MIDGSVREGGRGMNAPAERLMNPSQRSKGCSRRYVLSLVCDKAQADWRYVSELAAEEREKTKG